MKETVDEEKKYINWLLQKEEKDNMQNVHIEENIVAKTVVKQSKEGLKIKRI